MQAALQLSACLCPPIHPSIPTSALRSSACPCPPNHPSIPTSACPPSRLPTCTKNMCPLAKIDAGSTPIVSLPLSPFHKLPPYPPPTCHPYLHKEHVPTREDRCRQHSNRQLAPVPLPQVALCRVAVAVAPPGQVVEGGLVPHFRVLQHLHPLVWRTGREGGKGGRRGGKQRGPGR